MNTTSCTKNITNKFKKNIDKTLIILYNIIEDKEKHLKGVKEMFKKIAKKFKKTTKKNNTKTKKLNEMTKEEKQVWEEEMKKAFENLAYC